VCVRCIGVTYDRLLWLLLLLLLRLLLPLLLVVLVVVRGGRVCT
jgi:hypothetical protein